MKSPTDLSKRFARQWQDGGIRETRFLGDDAWPVFLPIGKPSPSIVAEQPDRVRAHAQAWQAETIGAVVWEEVTYRATGKAIRVPVRWELGSLLEWSVACGDKSITSEWAYLANLLKACDPIFQPLLVRQRSLWREKPIREVRLATEISMMLEPGCADGVPLRALPYPEIDSKFFERHRGLVTTLLDVRFDGEVSRQGLEGFLGAWKETDQWLLLADLSGPGSEILPYSQLRVRSRELAARDPGGLRLLVIENVKCLHQLPPMPGTLAVLGCGNNLAWLAAPWLRGKMVAYWGDLDTWGLTLLATARGHLPDLTALLMTQGVFDAHGDSSAVPEPVPASPDPPAALLPAEAGLYRALLTCDRGRLEQEFLPQEVVHEALREWG